jgi:long-chain acyl-CoA synthetase
MAELLLPTVTERPNAPAIIDEDGSTNWSDFNSRVNRLIHAVRSAGGGPGSTFAALCANRREYFEIFVMAAHAGVMVVPINWHWVADEVSYVLENAGVTILFADARYADVAVAGVAGAPNGSGVRCVSIGGAIPGFEDFESFLGSGSADEPADQFVGGPMFYTSGTTGRPKGVRGSGMPPGTPASFLSFMAQGFSASMGSPLGGVTFLNGPVYHSAQWAFSIFPLLGGSTVVSRHKFDAAETLRVIDEYAVTNVHLVPTQFIRLLKLPEPVKQSFDGSSLQVVWHGAASCPIEVKRRMLEWWGPKITEYYGATESGIVSLVNGDQWLTKPGTLGPIMGTCEVAIIDDEGNECPANVSGTIYVKSKMGSDFEYHGDPEKTAKAHRAPGQYTLGDVGYLDDDGWLFMSDRKIDMIISGGVNIYPAEIEGLLVTHPAVRDAAVFGVPDEEFGEQVKAALELADGFAAGPELFAELEQFCRAKLAGYKVPRSWDVHDAMPRHPTGKLYKRLLRDPYWQTTGRTI